MYILYVILYYYMLLYIIIYSYCWILWNLYNPSCVLITNFNSFEYIFCWVYTCFIFVICCGCFHLEKYPYYLLTLWLGCGNIVASGAPYNFTQCFKNVLFTDRTEPGTALQRSVFFFHVVHVFIYVAMSITIFY